MNRFTVIAVAIAMNLPALAAAAAAPEPGGLEVSYSGIETPKGVIMVALFNSEASYTSGQPVRAVMIPVAKADAATTIKGLPAGRYAIKSFHDLDGNGKMNTNPFGMPTEPFAFSNNARGAAGPAKWSDAVFDVAATGTKISITIK